MRRMITLLTVAVMMAVMAVVSASPAFADPVEFTKGRTISEFAKAIPPNPIRGLPTDPIKGQLISDFARTGGCVGCGGEDTPPSP